MSRAAQAAAGGPASIRERAPAKVNLLLHVGPRRGDGLHELCSLLASIDLADEVVVSASAEGADRVVCAGVDGPNICAAALDAFRSAADVRSAGRYSTLPPLDVRIEKRIPVAGGLGGGSADAAAVLRAANEIAGGPLDREGLRRLAATVGADVPGLVEPRHALVRGAGEVVEPIALPAMWLVLVPQPDGLSTAEVYGEADRLRAPRETLDPEAIRALAGASLQALAAELENDLQAAALSLRPGLRDVIARLRQAGALRALVTGSGPTVFGVFPDRESAGRAAEAVGDAVVAAIA